MHAAVAAGAHPDIRAAAAAMGKVRRNVYLPDEARADVYDALYREYRALHDYFGRGGNDVMHRLREIRSAAGGHVVTAAIDEARAAVCRAACRTDPVRAGLPGPPATSRPACPARTCS